MVCVGKTTQASKSHCESECEEEDKESKCVLILVADSYSNRDRKPIPLSEVDRFIWDKMGEKGVSRKKENGRGKMYEI